MEAKKEKISILQGVCATVIFIAYFLPWLQGTVAINDGTSVSFIEGVLSKNNLSSALFVATFFGGLHVSPSVLIILPIITLINVFLQWTYNAPRIAFYMNIIPTSICFVRYVISAEAGPGFSFFAGVGFFIVLIAGIVSTIAAWTVIAMHYYIKYKKFMKILTYCIGLSVLCDILMMFVTIGLDMMTQNIVRIYELISIIQSLIILHLPFLIYGWIVVWCTKNYQKKNLTAKEAPIMVVTPKPAQPIIDCKW